jgi:hypothetical protein
MMSLNILRTFLHVILLSWMEINIVQPISFMREFFTRLTMDLKSCQINVLHLISFIDKYFALILA